MSDEAPAGLEHPLREAWLRNRGRAVIWARGVTAMLNVLVTMRFHEAQLGRLREVSPRLRVRRDDPEIATYSRP